MATLDMTPDVLDIKVYANSKNAEIFKFVSGGQDWNLSGATVRAVAKASRGSELILVNAEVTPVDAAVGEFEIRWHGSDIAVALDGSSVLSGVYDIKVQPLGETEPTAILTGPWVAQMDVMGE
jgi:hypothetical protein